ncbi:HAD family hydrolase [Aquibium sp. A9E412]|uniref:HAD family hydrolase n=1 Tax=Aquibium sp. A9E412 TaxID=2976767 RepID=UPI0025AF6BCA|nr:HAD family hydrolase [Aquibium sp. A9E412]MDN2568031.1 HAD family hydrolase [Aquibium sp. A9E412]
MSAAAIKAILFDKDGTLIDFNRTWYGVSRRLALESADGDEARADALMAQAGYDAARGVFRPGSAIAAGTNADIVALWHGDLAPAAQRERIRHFDHVTAEAGAREAVPLAGMHDALAALREAGFALGVATNDSTDGAERTLLALGVAQMFDVVLGYDSVANPKPAADAVLAFADALALHPAQIAMVGDNRHDLVAGRAAGVGLNVAVLSGTGTRETLAPLADMLLGSIADLPARLAATRQGRRGPARRPPAE